MIVSGQITLMLHTDKQGFVNRMNNLTPIEWAVPLGLPIFFGEEQEK